MRGRTFAAALAGMVWLLAATSPASAGEKVWSGLVVATNVPRPRPPPPEMHRLEGTLRRTFGYNQFELIGHSHKALQSGQENWLASSKHFSLRVHPRGASGRGYRMNLQVFQDKQVLLETDATLRKSSPLVIRGPQVGSGQLLLLLLVQ